MKNLRPPKNEIEQNTRWWEIAHAHGTEELLNCDHPNRIVYRFNAIAIEVLMYILHRHRKIQKFIQGAKGHG